MDCDVVIVGGSAMGSATAFYLKRFDPSVKVAVIERDPTYQFASTVLSDGNVRVQFNLEENVRMSQYAADVIKTFGDDMQVGGFRPDVSPRRQGNLFTVTESGRASAHEGVLLQQSLGCTVHWLDADEISSRYPEWTAKGIVGGTLGPDDGSVDPHAVLHGYRRKAADMGVQYLQGSVTGIGTDRGAVSGVELDSGDRISAPVVVNCAGAWGTELAATAGVGIPVDPVMRSVYVVETPERPTVVLPSIFLPSGMYIIHENDNIYLIGWSLVDDPVGFDFTYSTSRFYDVLWPELIRWLPGFDQLRVIRGWAGLYAVNTLDGNAILGEWPELSGFFLANGFSGHGFQQCHAVGRYLAERILNIDPLLDLSRLGPQRIVDGEPVYENAGRLI